MDIKELLHELPGRSQSRRNEFQGAVKRLKKKRSGDIEKIMAELHEQAFDEIDCLECGNCCRSLGPKIIERDLVRLGKAQKMSMADLCESYFKRDEDNDWVFKEIPCPFLGDDNYCFVYDDRPKACSDYPHTEGRQVRSQIGQLVTNASTCPAVFSILDELTRLV